MRDDADQLPFALQRLDLCEDVRQRFLIQCAEAFVEEERVDPQLFAGRLRQRQRQRHADQKTFAAREVPHRTDLVALMMIDDVEIER